jgi:hypothetical protein
MEATAAAAGEIGQWIALRVGDGQASELQTVEKGWSLCLTTISSQKSSKILLNTANISCPQRDTARYCPTMIGQSSCITSQKFPAILERPDLSTS